MSNLAVVYQIAIAIKLRDLEHLAVCFVLAALLRELGGELFFSFCCRESLWTAVIVLY